MNYFSCNSFKCRSNIFWKKLDQNVTLLSAMHMVVKWIPKEAVLDRFFIFKLKQTFS